MQISVLKWAQMQHAKESKATDLKTMTTNGRHENQKQLKNMMTIDAKSLDLTFQLCNSDNAVYSQKFIQIWNVF